jgi:hypothetical protein
MAEYKCTNIRNNCRTADDQKIITASGTTPSCPECGSTALIEITSTWKKHKGKIIGILTLVGIVVAIVFWPENYSVDIRPSPVAEQGKVISLDAEKTLDCGSTCKHKYSSGTDLKLRAETNAGYRFVSWSGACVKFNQLSECTLPINEDKEVSANFAELPPEPVTLKITPPTSGGGKVVVAGDIDCGSDCSKEYVKGSEVKISANAEEGYQFVSWTGACLGTTNSECVLKMDTTQGVGVNFEKVAELVTLTVSAPASNEGRVVSTNPDGNINCGESVENCSGQYDKDDSITLAARAEKGFKFDSWGGACADVKVGICTLAMDGSKEISVIFKEDKVDKTDVAVPVVDTEALAEEKRKIAVQKKANSRRMNPKDKFPAENGYRSLENQF